MSGRVGERHRAREYALQLLFQLDLSPQDAEGAVEEFWEGKRVVEGVREFADELVRGTLASRDAIDGILADAAHNWRVSRMAVVDRNILRLAIFELTGQPDTPHIVIIDEAIELAKKFGDDESGPFVNGLLDAIRVRLDRGEITIPDQPGDRRDP